MSVLQIVLIFGVIPGGFVALVALLVFAPSLARAQRYRPGRPWNHDPVWYVPHPSQGLAPAARPGTRGGRARPTAVDRAPASVLDEVPTARGGAHGSW